MKDPVFIIKFFAAKWYTQLAIWFGIFTAILFPLIYYATDKLTVVQELKAVGAFSLLGALMGTGIMSLAKVSEKYYDAVRAFRERAKASTDEDELIAIRKEVIQHCRKKSSHMYMTDASRAVVDFIETRLQYEFKLVKND